MSDYASFLNTLVEEAENMPLFEKVQRIKMITKIRMVLDKHNEIMSAVKPFVAVAEHFPDETKDSTLVIGILTKDEKTVIRESDLRNLASAVGVVIPSPNSPKPTPDNRPKLTLVK